jgi:hypothetical protein
MNPKKQEDLAVEESDIFDSEVMQGSDPQKNIQEAVRCSMRARGIEGEEAKMGEEEFSFKMRQQ